MYIKMKRRVSFMVLVVAMLIMAFTVSVFATDNTFEMSVELKDSTGVSFEPTNYFKVGDKVTVEISVDSNPGIMGMMIGLKYDNTVFKPVTDELGNIKYTQKDLGLQDTATNVKLNDNKSISYTFKSEAFEIFKNTGTYVSFEFEIIAEGDVEDGSLKLECHPANLVVKPGDANLNVKINNATLNVHNICNDKITLEAKDPTCTETGLTEGKACSVCEKVIVKQEEIPALGHSFSDATCTESSTCSVCGQGGVGALGHEWGVGVVTDEPDCENDGTRLFTCSICGDTKEEIEPAKGHKWNKNYTVDVPSTCTESGTQSIHCELCDATKESVPIPELGHNYISNNDGETATCTEVGWTSSQTCSRCTDTIARQSTGKANHIYNEKVPKIEPTCSKTGREEYNICSVCKQTPDQFVAVSIPRLDHIIIIDKRVEPTCTSTGLTEGQHCANSNIEGEDRCGVSGVFVPQEVIPMADHKYVTTNTPKDPTCTSIGFTKAEKCSVCPYVKSVEEEIPMLPHTPVTDPRVESTCDVAGKTEGSHCSVCNNPIVAQETLPLREHNWGEEVLAPKPTCTTDGTWTKVCQYADCGKVATRVENMLDHDWATEKTTDVYPTCTEDGSESYHCSRCDEKKDVTVIPKLSHKYPEVGNVTKQPTCLDEGEMTYICERCENPRKEVIQASGHEWEAEFTVDVAPDCVNKGSKSIHCKNCVETKNITEMDKRGHDWDEGVITTKPTCTEEGKVYKTCQRTGCDQTKIDPVPAIGHIYAEDFTTDIAPTCTTEGSKSKHCTAEGCTAKSEVTKIPALGHTEVIDAKVEPTYTKTGLTEGKHCSVCETVLVAQTEIAKLFPWVWVIVGISVVAVGAVVVVYFTVIKKKNYRDDMFDDDDEDEE